MGKWAYEAACIFTEETGGVMEVGFVGRKLKPLVDLHGWPVVKPPWKRYWREHDRQFRGIDHFLKYGFAQYREDGRISRERARDMFRAAGLEPPAIMPEYFTGVGIQKAIEHAQRKAS